MTTNKSSISRALDLIPGSRNIVHSRLFQWASGVFLNVFPLRRRLKGSGIEYSVRDLENIYTAEEIMIREVYRDAFDDHVSTFIDLGANCGYFSCYAAHMAKMRNQSVKGIAVEANPVLLGVIKGNLTANRLSDVHAINGLVGRDGSHEKGSLQISNSHTSSSQFGIHPHDKWKKFGLSVEVPYVSVLELWKERFGETKIDLLKIDIEGSEKRFLDESPSILPHCRSVLIEIHKWLVDREEIVSLIERYGLSIQKCIEVDEWFETVLFTRVPNRSSRTPPQFLPLSSEELIVQ